MKSSVLHLRVQLDDLAVLKNLGSNILSQTQVASMLLGAAIEAARKNPGRLTFPVKLEVGTTTEINRYSIIEPSKPIKK